MIHIVKGIWHRLTKPVASIQEPERRRRARFLSSFLLVSAILYTATTVIGMPILGSIIHENIHEEPLFYISLCYCVGMFASYGLSLTRRSEIGGYIALPISVAFILISSVVSPDYIRYEVVIVYLMVPVLVTSLFEPFHRTIGLVGVIVVATMLIPILFEQTPLEIWFPSMPFLVSMSTLILIAMRHRDSLERDRQAALTEALERANRNERALTESNRELQQEITNRKLAEQQIKASLQEKEILLKEIHHRVKNNLQIVSSLLSLQSSQVVDETIGVLFRDSQDRIRSMALVHEQLYGSEDLARIEFGQYLRDLTSYLIRSYRSKGVNLRVEVDDVHLNIDTAIPCGLIINELASNALKHAFPDGREGEIGISLREDGAGQYMLIVRDDGVGFPMDVDCHHTESLGLQLVNSLVRQIKGTIQLHRDNGTMFEIRFAESIDVTG